MEQKTEAIGQVLQRTSPLRSVRSLSVQPRYSEAQKAAIEAFRGHFDTTQKLFNVFAPSNWGYMISHLDECLKSPCVTLSQVDAVYRDGVAKQIVRNQIAGVYSLCTARDQYNSSGIDMAADIFIAKYGHECTLYAMMVYFGNYMTEYKQSYAQFDIQDILQQFGKKFLPWWRQRLEPERPKTETTAKLTGMDALYRMLADRLLDGQTLDDIRQCSLFRWGFVKEEDLPKILEIAQDSF